MSDASHSSGSPQQHTPGEEDLYEPAPEVRGPREGGGPIREKVRPDDDGRRRRKHRHADRDRERGGGERPEKSPDAPKPKGEEKEGEEHNDEEEENKASKRKWIAIAVVAALLIVGLAVGIPYYLNARHFQNTDDAFIDAHYEKVAPQVAGRVVKVLVGDNQEVKAGDVLFQIDPASYQVSVEQARADLGEAQARIAQQRAQRQVAEAGVAQAQADLQNAQVNLENARTQLQRYESLSPESRVQQRLDDLRAAASSAEAQFAAESKKLSGARAQVELADAGIKAAEAAVGAAQGKVDQANLNLGYANVVATSGGRVANRSVQAGDFVSPGQQVMSLVPHEVWVTANFKETQLTDMKPGQEVEIKVDAYPDVEFRGRVDSVQKGSGTWFSLLPPQNASGNYVKVVQRVPVKIVFEDTSSEEYRRLGPGMSVVPKVRVK